MPAQPGDQGIWNGLPCTVYSVQTTAGAQFDTIILNQPMMRVVPDSQVQTTATPPLASPASTAHPATPGKPAKP